MWDWHQLWPWNLTQLWKGLKIKVRKFLRPIFTFVEVIGEKLNNILSRFNALKSRKFLLQPIEDTGNPGMSLA